MNSNLFKKLFEAVSAKSELDYRTKSNLANKARNLHHTLDTGVVSGEYSYIGELYERHMERLEYIETSDFESLTLAYAIMKAYGITNEEGLFNDYQLPLIEKELTDNYTPTLMYDVAMSILTDDAKYMGKFNSYDISIADAYTLATIITMLGEHKSRFTDIFLYKIEEILLAPRNLGREFVDTVTLLCETDFDRKQFKGLAMFEKAIKGKVSGKKNLELLINKGFSELNIAEIGFLLLYHSGASSAGNVKISRSIEKMLLTLAETKDVYNDGDIAILSELCQISDLPAKLDGGQLVTIRDILNKHQLIQKVSIDNFAKFVSIAKKSKKISEIDIDILDVDTRAKLMSMPEEERKYALGDVFRTSIINHSIDDVEKIVSEVETYEDVAHVEDFFKLKTHGNYYKGYFNSLCCCFQKVANAGCLDIEDIYAADADKNELLDDWLTLTNSNKKFVFLQNHPDYDYRYLLPRNAYDNDTDTPFIVDGTNEEKKTFIEMMGLKLIAASLTYFRNFFLNLMLTQTSAIRQIYSENEQQMLYQTALSLVNTIEDNHYYSYRGYYSKSNTIRLLNEQWMSEEEKARVKREKEEQERLENERRIAEHEADAKRLLEEAIKEEQENSHNTEYTSYINVCARVKRYHYDTKVYKEYSKNTLLTLKSVEIDDVKRYMELLGTLVSRGDATMNEVAEAIKRIEVIKEEVECA